MSTEFISFLGPTPSLSAYDRHSRADDQPDIPTIFKDAMEVRERVFVEEQQVPLENEFDDDDPRSCHWVVYASVGTSSSSGNGNGDNHNEQKRNSGLLDPDTAHEADADAFGAPLQPTTTANRVPVGTIRLVPPPHPPHPAPSDHHALDNSARAPPSAAPGAPTTALPAHPHEPYVKLGRLAIVPAYRTLGLASLLLSTALEWAAVHPGDVMPAARPEVLELAKAEGKEEGEEWRGLVLVHAQERLEGWYTKRGFVVDEGMGRWDEEGMTHAGMWKRVGLRGERGGVGA